MTGWGWMTPGGRLATLSVCALTSWLSLGAGMVLCCAGRRLWCGDGGRAGSASASGSSGLGKLKEPAPPFSAAAKVWVPSGAAGGAIRASVLAATAGTHGRVIWEACTSAASVGVCGAACGLESACGIPCVGLAPCCSCCCCVWCCSPPVMLPAPFWHASGAEHAVSWPTPATRRACQQCLEHRTAPCFVVHALPHTERDLPYHLQ